MTNVVAFHGTKKIEVTTRMEESHDGTWAVVVTHRMTGIANGETFGGEEVIALEMEVPNAFQAHEEIAAWHLQIAEESREIQQRHINQWVIETGLPREEIERRLGVHLEADREEKAGIVIYSEERKGTEAQSE